VNYDEEEAAPDKFPGVRTIAHTGKALLVEMPEWGGDKGVRLWIPKSVIHDDSEVYQHGHPDDDMPGTLMLKPWWVMEALEEYAKQKKVRRGPA